MESAIICKLLESFIFFEIVVEGERVAKIFIFNLEGSSKGIFSRRPEELLELIVKMLFKVIFT